MPSNLGVYEISQTQIKQMLAFAKIDNDDVFFDLGCGKGLAVRLAVTYGHAKKAIGVEVEPETYERARINAIRALSKPQLERTDFWLGHYDDDMKVDANCV